MLVVHSRYASTQSSGENTAVDRHVAALRAAGLAVELVEQRTDDRARRPGYPLEAAVTVATGWGPSPSRAIAAWRPDVVHVHNTFPNLGTRWLTRVPVPVVATLHNYRPLCPASTFFRDGEVCTQCLDRRSVRPSLVHGCYRDSRAATLPLALGRHFAQHPVLAGADRCVVLHDHMRDLYVQAGVDARKLRVLGNPAPDGGAGPGGDHYAYVGRLTAEKGVLELVRDWPRGRRLLVAGDGPLRAEVERLAGPGVEVLGTLSSDEVTRVLQTARGLVFPSRWFEGAPLTYAEALAAGTPVLAWPVSSVARSVRAQGTGVVVQGSVADALDAADRSFPGLRQHCRRTYEQQYTEQAWLAGLLELYREVIDDRTGPR